MKHVKIAYIGGGSKMWARVFMNDLALSEHLCGLISLYDIDIEAATRNKKIGDFISKTPNVSKWNYEVKENIDDALSNADFVILSILPGTFTEMQSDVHHPENYGIYQTVGDTVGPGGVLRAMRTVPIYEFFARKIKEICPNAWVINLTNPMSICVKTLYDVFPNIKAIGCCHEVFHAQDFICMVIKEKLGLEQRPNRLELKTDVSGINHFTWITSAIYQNKEVLPWIYEFMDKHFEEGIYEGDDPYQFKYDTFAYGNKVKMDLFKRYGILAAAGDRHLVEFVNNDWYLKNLEEINDWAISITKVSSRVLDMNKKIEESILLSSGKKDVEIVKSSEEAVQIMEALAGVKDLVSNINYPNYGQVSYLPKNSIVESNCKFTNDKIELITSNNVSSDVANLILRNCLNIDTTYEGIKKRDLNIIFNAFINQPLCSKLSISEGKKMFKEMIINTRTYLDPYYDIDKFLKE